ncbi:MAG: selenide, water dikinase SelD, partial [Planctomycetes bacterium]|nr:selenide, water dikinase SelD [Planctomycetota bacterium]
TPVVDDPYTFGAIAAANAISDIYAMGAKPIFALNILAFPLKTLGHDVLREILRGGADKAKEAGIAVAGGHSIDDAEPKYGMVVNGLARKEQILANSGAKPGDVIVLTKPIGAGIATTAVKRGVVAEAEIKDVIASMSALNRPSGEAAVEVGARAGTDITGFGLIGHLGHIARESKVTIEVDFQTLPLFPKAVEFAKQGIAPGGTRNNLKFYGDTVTWQGSFEEWQQLLFADAQTSGGMAICVSPDKVDDLRTRLTKKGALASAIIGRVMKQDSHATIVRVKNP